MLFSNFPHKIPGPFQKKKSRQSYVKYDLLNNTENNNNQTVKIVVP